MSLPFHPACLGCSRLLRWEWGLHLERGSSPPRFSNSSLHPVAARLVCFMQTSERAKRSWQSLRNSGLITTFLHRTVIKKEEKVEKKEEKKPEDIKKEEKDEDELKPGATNRSRVTKSGDETLSVQEPGRASQGGGWRVS